MPGKPDCGNGRLYSHENAPYCVSDFSRAFDVRIYGAHDRAACSRFYARRSNGVAFELVQFLLVLPILYVNRKFYVNGFKALWHRVPNMDSLVAVGSSAAVIYGVFAIFMISYGIGNGNLQLAEKYLSGLYFESGGMILTLVTVGKLLEERSKNKTYSAIQKLIDLAPKTALVLRDGEEVEITVDKIAVGDIILLKPGSSVPVDGEVTEGGGTVDESALTGESMPVEKNVGAQLISASIVKSGAFKIKARRVGTIRRFRR